MPSSTHGRCVKVFVRVKAADVAYLRHLASVHRFATPRRLRTYHRSVRVGNASKVLRVLLRTIEDSGMWQLVLADLRASDRTWADCGRGPAWVRFEFRCRLQERY